MYNLEYNVKEVFYVYKKRKKFLIFDDEENFYEYFNEDDELSCYGLTVLNFNIDDTYHYIV